MLLFGALSKNIQDTFWARSNLVEEIYHYRQDVGSSSWASIQSGTGRDPSNWAYPIYWKEILRCRQAFKGFGL